MQFINHNQLNKNGYFYISSVFFAFSFLLILFSYNNYSNKKLEPNFESKRVSDISVCKKFAESKGLEVKLAGRGVVVAQSNDSRLLYEEPAIFFSSIESVLLRCNNIKLKSFCLGVESECGIEGVKMVLTYVKPKAE